MKNAFRDNNAGFTLVEMLVSLGIFTLVIGAVAAFFTTGYKYTRIIWEQLSTQNDGRLALQKVVDDVRRAETSSIGSFPIAIASTTELVLYANEDGDVERERVRYYLSGLTLKRGVVQPSGSPLQYVTSTEVSTDVAHDIVNVSHGAPVFTYYGSTFTGTQAALTQPVNVTNIRMIKVQLEMDENPTQSPVPLHVESFAQVRNLKSN